MNQQSWQSGLYLVTPNWDDTEKLLAVSEIALKAGVSLMQYRHKTASTALRFEQAQALLKLCRAHRVPLVINDHIALCSELDADGVHVGGTDMSVAQARMLLGKNKIIGASCYGELVLAEKACEQQASYVAFGGFYPSVVKQYPVTTPADILERAKAVIPLPIVVIGGMTPELAQPLVNRGANLVAAISSVYNSVDPHGAVREFISLFK